MMTRTKLAILAAACCASALSARTSQAANEWFWANEYGPLLCEAGGAYALDCTYNDFIYHQTGPSSWAQVPGTATTITSDANGDPWTTDYLGHIHYGSPNMGALESFDSSTYYMSVAVGNPSADYNVWAVKWDGTIGVFSGNAYNAGSWSQVPGAARKIAVLSKTTTCDGGRQSIYVPWVVNNENLLYAYVVSSSEACDSGHFEQIQGAATDIASSYVIGTDNNVWYYNYDGAAWTNEGKPAGATLETIGAGPDEEAYVTASNGYAWQLLLL